MNSSHFSVQAGARSRLRAALAKIEGEISRLPGQARGDLLTAFTDLVEQLALGPEPEMRQCPLCGQMGRRAATRCGYCWSPLTPLPERDGFVG